MGFINNICSWYNRISKKKYFYILAAVPWVIWCLAVFWYCRKNCYIGLEQNDDMYLNMIAGGIFGENSPYIVFPNIVYGWVLAFLYKLSPAHNWFNLFQLGLIAVSYMAFGIFYICRDKILKGYLVSFIFFFTTFPALVNRMNYSKTGAVAVAVGIVLLWYCAECDERKSISCRLSGVFGFLFLLAGGLVRKDTTIACVPFLLVPFVYLLIQYRKDAIKRMIPAIAALALLLVLWCMNGAFYHLDKEWDHYKKFDAVTAELTDYGVPSYYSNPEKYEELGLTVNDYVMFLTWRFADENIYSIDTLNRLISLRENPASAPGKTIERTLVMMVEYAKSFPSFYVIVFIFLIAGIITDRKLFGYQLATFGICFGEFLLLVYRGRVGERAVMIPFFVSFALLTYFFDRVREKSSDRQEGMVTAIVLGFTMLYSLYAGGFTGMADSFINKSYDKTSMNALYSYTAAHSDSLYVIDILEEVNGLINTSYPLDSLCDIDHSNVTYTGTWLSSSPILNAIARPYGDDPTSIGSILSNNPDAYYIVSGDFENNNFVMFMREHYSAEPRLADTAGDYNIVSFYGN